MRTILKGGKTLVLAQAQVLIIIVLIISMWIGCVLYMYSSSRVIHEGPTLLLCFLQVSNSGLIGTIFYV